MVTVPTLKPYPSANDYAMGLYQKWGIGSAQDEHGVLILLAVQERQAAVTMGRRMIPVMGGEVVGRVGHEYLDPAIKKTAFRRGAVSHRRGLGIPLAGGSRVSSTKKAHFRGLGFWITVTTASGALWFLSSPSGICGPAMDDCAGGSIGAAGKADSAETSAAWAAG